MRSVERGKKPPSVLFGRAIHRGKPVAIEDMDAAVIAAREAQRAANSHDS
jgi:hypothetical protein